MNDVLEIALILDYRRFNRLYHAGLILGIILFITVIILFTFKYQSYYKTMGTMINGKLELLVNIKDIKIIDDNDTLIVDNQQYEYTIVKIDEELYRDDSFNNYKNIYLEIKNLSNINNYVYEIKIPGEYKALANYIKDLIKEV